MRKVILDKEKIKNKLKNFTKKILAMTIILTNLFYYIPIVSVAADDSDERYPATVPGIANEIISKYVSTRIISGGAAGSSTISTYEEKGDGWDSITEVVSSNGTKRTYRNYKQYNNGNSYWNKAFWGGNIWSSGCGPSAVAIVLSGYGYDCNPGQVVQTMQNNGMNNSGSFANLRYPLKKLGNIDAEDHYGKGTSKDIAIIRENLAAGRPVIANVPNHYVVFLGEDENGHLIISDPGRNDSVKYRYGKTLEEVIRNGKITCGYILIKSDGNASSGTSSSSNESEDSKETNTDDLDKKDESTKQGTPKGTGEAKVQNCNIKNGYSAIFTSGTTGRQFKEYRQNIDGWNSKYKIGRSRLFMDIRVWTC